MRITKFKDWNRGWSAGMEVRSYVLPERSKGEASHECSIVHDAKY